MLGKVHCYKTKQKCRKCVDIKSTQDKKYSRLGRVAVTSMSWDSLFLIFY